VGLLIRSLTEDFRRIGGSVPVPVVNLNFVFTVATTTDGETFTVPTQSGSSYNCNVNWGDSSDDDITTYNDAAWTHTYATAGIHEISIGGTFGRIYFSNGGDKLKVRSWSNVGDTSLSIMASAWRGCSNMTLDFDDGANLAGIARFDTAFFSASSVTTIPFMNTSDTTNLSSAFRSMTSLTSFPSIDTGSNQNFSLMCASNTSMSTFPALDYSSGTNFSTMLYNCPITSFSANMFDSSTSATSYANTFLGCALDQTSVDNILVSWNASGVSGLTGDIDGGTSAAPSAVGDAAIVDLVADGWTITTN
jgi:hypothetical protein